MGKSIPDEVKCQDCISGNHSKCTPTRRLLGCLCNERSHTVKDNEYAKFRIICKPCNKGKHEKCSDSQKTKSSIGKNEICVCKEYGHNPK